MARFFEFVEDKSSLIVLYVVDNFIRDSLWAGEVMVKVGTTPWLKKILSETDMSLIMDKEIIN